MKKDEMVALLRGAADAIERGDRHCFQEMAVLSHGIDYEGPLGQVIDRQFSGQTMILSSLPLSPETVRAIERLFHPGSVRIS